MRRVRLLLLGLLAVILLAGAALRDSPLEAGKGGAHEGEARPKIWDFPGFNLW